MTWPSYSLIMRVALKVGLVHLLYCPEACAAHLLAHWKEATASVFSVRVVTACCTQIKEQVASKVN